jgi:hypothetical protein
MCSRARGGGTGSSDVRSIAEEAVGLAANPPTPPRAALSAPARSPRLLRLRPPRRHLKVTHMMPPCDATDPQRGQFRSRAYGAAWVLWLLPASPSFGIARPRSCCCGPLPSAASPACNTPPASSTVRARFAVGGWLLPAAPPMPRVMPRARACSCAALPSPSSSTWPSVLGSSATARVAVGGGAVRSIGPSPVRARRALNRGSMVRMRSERERVDGVAPLLRRLALLRRAAGARVHAQPA